MIKKLFAGIISALIGLILIPILAFDFFSFKWLPLLIVYFLPGFCIGLIILFELLTRIRSLKKVYSFVQDIELLVLFFALLAVQWIIMWNVDPGNDVVFASQFATATVPSIWIYDYLGRRMKFLKSNKEKI
jgi:hypothetical protein